MRMPLQQPVALTLMAAALWLAPTARGHTSDAPLTATAAVEPTVEPVAPLGPMARLHQINPRRAIVRWAPPREDFPSDSAMDEFTALEDAVCTPEGRASRGDPQVLLYNNVPYTAWWLGCDSEHFCVRLVSSEPGPGPVLIFPWARATLAERKMLARQFGLTWFADQPAWGASIDAEKLTLISGEVRYGFSVAVRSDQGGEQIQFTGPHSARLLVDRTAVKTLEKIRVPESVVYTNQELYVRRKYTSTGLTTAAEHFRMAVFCKTLFLPDEGLDHLEASMELDARFDQTTDPAVAELARDLKALKKLKAPLELFGQIVTADATHDAPAAARLGRQFLKIFPADPRSTLVRALLARYQPAESKPGSAPVQISP